MAKDKHHSKSMRSSSKEAERIEREYRRLALAIGDAEQFRLYLAIYDEPRRRDELIARLEDEARQRQIWVTRLDIGGESRETSLVRLLREHIQSNERPPGRKHAVMLTGLEQLLAYGGSPEDHAFLQDANLQRDALPQAAPVPTVVWLSPLAGATLPKVAPDLWHWRAASFDFTDGLDGRADLLRGLLAMPLEGKSLSKKHERERVAMLHELLDDLDRAGPPKTKRQIAERLRVLADLLLYCENTVQKSAFVERLKSLQLQMREIADDKIQRLISLVMGRVYLDCGELEAARLEVSNALKRSKNLRDGVDHSEEFTILGEIALRRREPNAAEGYFKKALASVHKTSDPSDAMRTFEEVGRAYLQAGQAESAIVFLADALKIARDKNKTFEQIGVLKKLGKAYDITGNKQSATECLEEALAISNGANNYKSSKELLHVLGATYLPDDAERAADYYDQAIKLAERHKDLDGKASALGALSLVYCCLGEPGRAVPYYEEALSIARETGHLRASLSALLAGVLAQVSLGERSRAEEFRQEALAILREGEGSEIAQKAKQVLAVFDSALWSAPLEQTSETKGKDDAVRPGSARNR